MSLAICKAALSRVHWSIWTALSLVALYSALGFWAVPAALRYTLTHTLAEQWQRPVTVGEISFNPFEMELKIADFAIANQAKTEIINDTGSTVDAAAANTEQAIALPTEVAADVAQEQVQQAELQQQLAAQPEPVLLDEVELPEIGDLIRFELLHINVHVASVFKRQIGFETIELIKPYIRAELDKQGKLELLQVFVKTAAANEASPSANAAPAAVGEVLEASNTASAPVAAPAAPTAADEEKHNEKAVAAVKRDIETAAEAKGGGELAVAQTSTAAAPAEPETTADSEAATLPPIWLAKLAIEQGEIDFIDHSRADFAQKLLLKGIEIEDFHTARDDRSNRIALQLNDSQTGEISFRTDHFRLQPFRLKGQLAIEQLALAPVWQWLNLPVNFALTAPVLDLQTELDIDQGDNLAVKTHSGQLRLIGTKLAPRSQVDKHLIQLHTLAVNNIEFDLQQQLVQLGELSADGVQLELLLDKQGNLNILPMFASEKSPTPEKQVSDEAEAQPWRVVIKTSNLSNGEVLFTDESPSRPFKTTIAPIGISVGEFEPLNSSKIFTISAELGVGSEKLSQQGKLKANADIALSPFNLSAQVRAADLPLALVQPYVADSVRARLSRGELNADLAVTMQDALRVKGEAAIDQLQLHHQSGRASLLSLDKLQLTGLDYQAANNALSIQTIALNKLVSSFRINEDGSTNIQDLVIEQPASNKPATAPLQFAINTIAINNADLGFADHTLSQNFQVAIKDLSGKIKNIKSNSAQLASVDLAGKVDHYAPATIKGSFNVFGAQPTLDMGVKLDNVELTSFTPYSGTYAGFKIERGQLDIDLHYQLADNKIVGKNRIVMDQFTLGEKVESAKAIDLPLRLALALLRDEKGVIDLGFEVNGDLDDPSFSIGGILWKVLSNIVKKAVASPMKALGMLSSFGGDGEGNAIEFAAGSFELTDLAKKQAAELKSALEKRSEFRLNLQGNVLPDTDRLALQRKQLAANLAAGDLDKQQQWLSGTARESMLMRRQLAKLYQRKLNKSYDEAEATIAEQFANANKDELALRTFNSVFDELAVSLSVDDSGLRQLALDRAIALKAYMTEELGFEANRVMIVDYNTDQSIAGTNCLIQLGM